MFVVDVDVVVVVVWFCCSSWLAFLMMAGLINLMRHFLFHWVVCFGGDLFVHTAIFFEKILDFIFGGFLSVPHLVDNYAKNLNELYVQSYITELPCCF